MDTLEQAPVIDVDELIKTVAVRYGVALDKNDPILVTVGLHEVVLSRYIDILSEQNRRYQKELSAAIQNQVALAEQVAQRQIDTAKGIAELTITKGAEYVAKEVCAMVEAQVRKTMEEALARVNAVKTEAREMWSVRNGAVWAAVMAGACALTAALASVAVLMD